MADAIALGPLVFPPLVFAGFFTLFMLSAVIRFVFPRRFPEETVSLLTDTIAPAFILGFLVWKIWPIFTWYREIAAAPILLLRMPGGRGGVIGGVVAVVVYYGMKVRGRRELLAPLAAAAVTGTTIFAMVIAVMTAAAPAENPGVLQDSPSALREFPLLSGGTVPLLENGTPTVLTFWASWCGPCVAELPAKEAFFRESPVGVRHFAVNMTRSESSITAVEEFAARHSMTTPIMLDTEGIAAATFGVRGTPTTVFISGDRRVVHRWMGPSDIGRLRRALADIF